FLLLQLALRPTSSLFPYTTLFRSHGLEADQGRDAQRAGLQRARPGPGREPAGEGRQRAQPGQGGLAGEVLGDDEQGVLVVALDEDRKSTRLNSSHVKISYAVLCLK